MTVAVPVLAVAGFADKFASIGPYVGFGSLIAVAAMAILVFSQGRELQRLREWAGSAPERLAALEQRIEQELRRPRGPALAPHQETRAPGAVPPARPAAPPGTPPTRPATATSAASAQPAVGATAVTGASTTAPASGSAGSGSPPPPAPPRPTPPDQAAASGGGDRPGARPTPVDGPRPATAAGAAGVMGSTARERGDDPHRRSIPQIVGVALLVIALVVGVLFAAGVIGGGSSPAPSAGGGGAAPARGATFNPAQTRVAVLNASGVNGAASATSDVLDNQRFATVGQGATYPSTQDDSVVGYTPGAGNREAAEAVAKKLAISASTVRPASTELRQVAGGKPDVIVVLGKTWANGSGGRKVIPPQSTKAPPSSSSSGSTSSGSSGAAGSSGSPGGSGPTGSTTGAGAPAAGSGSTGTAAPDAGAPGTAGGATGGASPGQ